MKINITIIILLIFTTSAFACNGTENELEHSLKHYKYTIDGPFNIKEMESRNLIRTNKGLLPFGKVNKEWVAMKNLYKKGDELETVILAIDSERERISLGIKQLADDPFSNFIAENEKGGLIKGVVKEVDVKFATITLSEDIEGIIKASEVSVDKVDDVRTVLKVGDEIEARVVGTDRKNRVINLSVKAKDVAAEKVAIQDHKKQETENTATPTTIGDLIKAQMESNDR